MYKFTIWNVSKPQRNFRLLLILTVTLLLNVIIFGCSPASKSPSDIAKGVSKSEVIASLGEPDQVQDFILPDVPFFGPQESLVNLVAPGTVIEEWVYEIGDDLFYVWFTGKVDDPRQDWLVLDTARHPKDAVY